MTKISHFVIAASALVAAAFASLPAQAAQVVGHKNIGAPAPNAVEVVHVVYDFSVDAGATGALDLATTTTAVVIQDFHCVVKTTATSGGSATVKVGITGDDDSFIKTTEGAVANLTANALFQAKPELTEGTPNTIAPRVPVRLASGDKVLLTIGTAALTAGKLDCAISLMRD